MSNHWFNSVPEFNFNSDEVIGSNLSNSINEDKNSSVVLIGLNEAFSNLIRTQLFSLHYHFENIDIIDAGNVRNLNTEFLIPIIKEYLENGYCIVFLGHEKGQNQNLIKALVKAKKNITWAIASESIDSEITSMPTELLNRQSFLGHQIHLIDPKVVDLIRLKEIKKLSLGEYRSDFTEAEPFLREVSALFLDINVTKGCEIGNYLDTHPSGLTSEEVCQLTRYAGLSEQCNVLSIFSNFDNSWTSDTIIGKLIAQYIWYFLFGMKERREDKPDLSENVIKYVVHPIDISKELTFLKSKKTGRWWLEIGKPGALYEKEFISISRKDYELAKTGNLSDRILSALNKS